MRRPFPRSTPSPEARRGLTLIEAIISMSIVAIAGTSLMLALGSALQTTNWTVDQAIAQGLAEQLVDEVAGKRYHDPAGGSQETILGPSGAEAAGPGRSLFNDADDYNGFRAQGAEDIWGRPLGTGDGAGGDRHLNFQSPAGSFDDWRQEIDVYYVDDDDHSIRLGPGSTSFTRAVEVRILVDDPLDGLRELANVRRVFSYLPGN